MTRTALDVLQSRKSHPARMLGAPFLARDQIETLLTIAARVPDHGKLVPWRFVVLSDTALTRMAELVPARGEALGIDPEKIAKVTAQYRDSGLAIAVIACPKGGNIPAIEQTLSAGAVCMNILHAAEAMGFGANWLSGWASFDAQFTAETLNTTGEEFVAGIIHIGTVTGAVAERPRPDLAAITTWA